MSGPASQGYKISGEGHAGGGPDGTRGQNTSQPYPGSGGAQQSVGPAQEMAGTLPNNYSLGPTKAESKGEENTIPNHEQNDQELNTLGRGGDTVRQPIHAHDVDYPARAPHQQPQAVDSSRPIHSNTIGPRKGAVRVLRKQYK